MKKKMLRVGFDFDGVVAYNPFRIIRAPIAYVKRDVLGIKKLKFFYPTKPWEQFIWRILHDSSVFPAKGVGLLERLVAEGTIEAHLITARYSFLDHHLDTWLKKHGVKQVFRTINWNKNDEQPHLFKEKLIRQLNPDIFIEDNLDIVTYLHGRTHAKIFWIYNILDRNYPHPHKYPYLQKALEEIMEGAEVQSGKAAK